jgi:hypothetical protein
MTSHQFCTPGWLKESARIFKAKPEAKDQLKKLTAKICYTDFILGKINLELGTKVKIIELALPVNNIFDFLTQVDLQFPDEMSEDELTSYRSKIEVLRRERGS